MTKLTLHTEICTAAELRRRALSKERIAKVNDHHGLTRAAARERQMAAGLRQLAALVECAPFEVAQDTPAAAVLVRSVALQVRPWSAA